MLYFSLGLSTLALIILAIVQHYHIQKKYLWTTIIVSFLIIVITCAVYIYFCIKNF